MSSGWTSFSPTFGRGKFAAKTSGADEECGSTGALACVLYPFHNEDHGGCSCNHDVHAKVGFYQRRFLPDRKSFFANRFRGLLSHNRGARAIKLRFFFCDDFDRSKDLSISVGFPRTPAERILHPRRKGLRLISENSVRGFRMGFSIGRRSSHSMPACRGTDSQPGAAVHLNRHDSLTLCRAPSSRSTKQFVSLPFIITLLALLRFSSQEGIVCRSIF